MFIERKFPNTRLRRLRRNNNLIDLVSETSLTSNDLIQPIFIKENLNGSEEIETMPNIFRYGIEKALKEIEDIKNSGINSIAVFPVIDTANKDSKGSQAANSNNFVSTAIKAIKKEFPDIILIADVALDPYTDHGHDGVIINNEVDNDETIKILIEQSLILADSGADIIAPSDMMDGRIGLIRNALEQNSYKNTILLSYAAKFNSKFYGPFRDAVGSASSLGKSSKSSYQMSSKNKEEALHEVAMDINEGADIIMVKPAMPYLDIIHLIKDSFKIPTFAYQVSGEYSMLKLSINKGWLESEVMLESLISIKRAGADAIFSYAAKEISMEMQNK
ncbi:MAG: delta-aminolevulinic acid dehydratase [Gammaproteobacteria bacterium TMED226]|nr:MAG: delta-aminolevulinic acid dehydratase [Gammaproteobacteria bacterium TMED226]|tara:strand:- start:14748 stop:15746 length:999 start_codon:yes stop_codon:yes gene_type:complete